MGVKQSIPLHVHDFGVCRPHFLRLRLVLIFVDPTFLVRNFVNIVDLAAVKHYYFCQMYLAVMQLFVVQTS